LPAEIPKDVSSPGWRLNSAYCTYVLMTEIIKVEVDEALAKRFRKRAMEKYGYKKGAITKAMEEAMKKYSSPAKADWGSLVGVLKSDRGSVWLQHHAWDRSD
jgi:hypothetical protein